MCYGSSFLWDFGHPIGAQDTCGAFLLCFLFFLLSLFKIYGLTRFAAVCFTMTWTREKLHVNVVTELYRPFWKGVLFRVCLSDLSNFRKKGRKCHYNKKSNWKTDFSWHHFVIFWINAIFVKIQNVGKVINTSDFDYEIHAKGTKDIRSLVFDFAHENGLKILSLQLKNQNLEQLFNNLTN